jgi:isopentenyldiphosphate isomerase
MRDAVMVTVAAFLLLISLACVDTVCAFSLLTPGASIDRPISARSISLTMQTQEQSRQYETGVACSTIRIPKALMDMQKGTYAITKDGATMQVCVSTAGEDSGSSNDSSDSAKLSLSVNFNSVEMQNADSTTFVLGSLLLAGKRKNLSMNLNTGDGKCDAEVLSMVDTVMQAEEQAGETVDWVACDGTPIMAFPRLILHKFNVLHQGIGALLTDMDGAIYVHKRSSSKRLFPSMYDMFIGGVSSSGESSIDTLLRELSEEVGLDFLDMNISETQGEADEDDSTGALSSNAGEFVNVKNSQKVRKKKKDVSLAKGVYDSSEIRYIGDMTCMTSYNHVLVHCYVVKCSSQKAKAIRFADGEIESGAWMTMADLQAMVAESRDTFVPDGLQVWDALPDMLRVSQAPPR